jgi:hypothetical protein
VRIDLGIVGRLLTGSCPEPSADGEDRDDDYSGEQADPAAAHRCSRVIASSIVPMARASMVLATLNLYSAPMYCSLESATASCAWMISMLTRRRQAVPRLVSC